MLLLMRSFKVVLLGSEVTLGESQCSFLESKKPVDRCDDVYTAG